MPWEVLNTRVLNRYIEPLTDRRTNPVPANLIMLNRTPEVQRTDEEIVVGFTGHVFAADIIADDAKAITKTADTLETKVNKVPNLKIGKLITQTMAALLYRIEQRAALPGEPDTFRNYIFNKYKENIQSIRIRQEALLNAMSCGVLNYDALGIKLQNVTFGMPAAYRVTPDTYYSDVASTPISDILDATGDAQQANGQVYNRLELSRTAFDYVVGTNQFRDRALLFTAQRSSFPTASDPFANVNDAQTLLGNLLKMTVELRDETYEDQLNDGSIVVRRFHPENLIKFSNSGDDNNQSAREFSFSTPIEELMMNLPGVNVVGGATGNARASRGTLAYASVTPDLNPPNATLWAVKRGFPAKNKKTETLTIKAYA